MIQITIFTPAVGFTLSAAGQEWIAPEAPDPAADLMPTETDSFWEGCLEIFREAIPDIMPSFAECIGICVSLFAVIMMVSVLNSLHGNIKSAADLTGTVVTGFLLIQPVNSLMNLGIETIRSVSEYGKLLLPVMTASLAGSGGTVSSAALYAGTVFFDSVLCSLISSVLTPMLAVYLCFSAANAALADEVTKNLSDFVKWLTTWSLKTVLYVFTGYISVTGVISGTTDAAAMKAAKLTISGVVPVVGGILSDASEAVLVGAEVIRNSVGVYGMLAIFALFIRPFLQIGVQYLMIKLTTALCSVIGKKGCVSFMEAFSWCMGMLLAMTGAECLLMMISVICFMRGVG